MTAKCAMARLRLLGFFIPAWLLFLHPQPADAESQKWWTFEGRRYYEPLTAGVREPHISALALAWGSRMPFMVRDDDPRQVWDIDVGAELPIFGWESRRPVNQQKRVPQGAIGFGLWIPIDFHMIEDFADDSGPIVNTDYRFGVTAKVQRGLPESRWLSMRLSIGHESTHLGDEFSIIGQRRFPRTFERVNVSWEFLDAGVLYEERSASPFWSFRAGITSTLPFEDTYYSTDPGSITESRLGPVTPSSNWIDPYAGFEIEWEDLFFEKWGVYASGEMRWRSVFDYHKARADEAEERQASINLIAGIRKSGSVGELGRASPFLRVYHGVNPHGQFRNQKDYTQYGVGVRLIR